MASLLDKLGITDSKDTYDDDFIYFWDDIDDTEYIVAEKKTLIESLSENVILVLYLIVLACVLTLVGMLSSTNLWLSVVTGGISSASMIIAYVIIRNKYVEPMEILLQSLKEMNDDNFSGTDDLLFTKDQYEILEEFDEMRMKVTNYIKDYREQIRGLRQEISLMHNMVTEVYRSIDSVNLSFDNSVSSTANYQELRNYLTQLSNGVDVFTENFDNSLEAINEITGTLKSIGKQTTMLALNAGIEAAKAGTRGRGFEVVASNLRRLAQHAIDTSNRVQSLSDGINETAKESLENIATSSLAIETMIDSNHGVTSDLNNELFASVGDLNTLRSEYNKLFGILEKNENELSIVKL